jgi:hypothetical protein
VWSIGRPDWLFESWFIASLAVVASAALLSWRHWKQALLAALSFGGGSVLALATKYVLDIGERHHSDTSNVLGLAVVAIQGEISDLTPLADSFKRGISYPLMLGLGPDGRILGGFTPLVYLALLGTAVWVAWTLVGNRVSRRAFVFSTAGVAVFSVSVPIFRAAMFYLNGHTLMAYALILLVGGVAIASHQKAFTRLPAALVLLGGTLGVTSRIEGIVLVGLVLLLLLSQRWWSGSIERIRLALTVALIGLTLSWWLISLESPVLEEFGLAGGLLLAASVGGGALAASSWINPFRRWLYPGAALAVVAKPGPWSGGVGNSGTGLRRVGRPAWLARPSSHLSNAHWPDSSHHCRDSFFQNI